jgi:carbon storage regulator
MLILTRKLGEAIAIGDEVKVHLLEIKGRQVKVGVEAPAHITVHREEIYRSIREQNLKAAAATGPAADLREVWERLKG